MNKVQGMEIVIIPRGQVLILEFINSGDIEELRKKAAGKEGKMRSSRPHKGRAQDDGLKNSFDDIFRIEINLHL